jgi:hypothetical protein
MHGLAAALDIAASLACDQRNLTKVELYSSELIELSTRHRFAYWMGEGLIYRRWGLSVAERFDAHAYDALLLRLRGVFLTAIGAEDARIESSFCEAVKVAQEQKSFFLASQAEATYAEFRRRSASATGGSGFRLPLL